MSINVQELLREITPEAPCGIDIGYDPQFLELEVLVRGKPESQVGKETAILPAEEPDWKVIESRCLDLIARSKDLRLALFLTIALLRLEGIPGLRDGIALLRGMVEKYWDTVYPRLDPEDNNDPTERLNVIASLAPPPDSVDEFLRLRDRLLDAPICSSRQFGRWGLRQILWAAGELPVPTGQTANVPEAGVLQAAFEDTDIEQLKGLRQALEESIVSIRSLDELLVQRVGARVTVNLAALVKLLERALVEAARQLERRGFGSANPMVSSQPGATAGAAQTGVPGIIGSSQDAIQALNRICEYFERHEPSSPVPLLLKRARRLVGKSFTDIILDISPDAVRQVELIGGAAPDSTRGIGGSPTTSS